MEKYSSERIFLRELSSSDVNENYLSWFNDEQVTQFLEAKNLTKQSVIEYIEHGKNTKLYYMFAICDAVTNEHIGNLKIGPIDHKHKTSDLVTVIGNKNYWGKGVATEAIKLGNQMAFDEFAIRKLTGGMYSDNVASLKAYTKAGWVIEGYLKGHYVLDGKTLDRICVSCFNRKYFNIDAAGNFISNK